MFTDAHIHIFDTVEKYQKISRHANISDYKKLFRLDVFFCASADKYTIFEAQELLCKNNSNSFVLSFGIHPQNPCENEVLNLENLIKAKRIKAIGECGFDLFNDEYRATEQQQKKVWDLQLTMAIEYGMPIVVHCRKALHLLFNDINRLKKLPAVIFHGWSGSALEANSFLKKGINAYFCIGKGLLRGQKSQIDTAKLIDINHLLTETDAPYMTLRGEEMSFPNDIKKVVLELIRIRNGADDNSDNIILKLHNNFFKAYSVKT